MELKELLALNEPSVEQYGEMEKQLLSIARAASAEITRLDAEGLARGADRLLGHDDGGEARAAARATAEQRRSDAENVLADVRGKSASLQARLEKEADEQAWAEVRRLFAARSRAMEEIDALCSKIGELYEAVIENGQTAQNAAPVKINLGSAFELQGRMPSQIGVAIMSRVHLSVGRPFSVQAVNIDQFCTAYDNQIRFNGLPGFLGPVHNAILLHSQ